MTERTERRRKIVSEVEYLCNMLAKAAQRHDTYEMNLLIFDLRELQQEMICMEVIEVAGLDEDGDQPRLV
jgi:hypothetical protein